MIIAVEADLAIQMQDHIPEILKRRCICRFLETTIGIVLIGFNYQAGISDSILRSQGHQILPPVVPEKVNSRTVIVP